ncbi:MAG: HD domain-containing protein [Caldilineaceae bacterium]|nr:HD domain-containing protein [Caldilineaceae bacterium]
MVNSTNRRADKWRYRIHQFWAGWRATVHQQELADALVYLPAKAGEQFRQLPVDAQRHSLNVLHLLRQAGSISPDLAAAALLHDVGKLAAAQAGVAITLWVRGPLVLLARLAPHWLERWASPHHTHGWRYALYVHQMHPQIGAEWAAAWGCSPLTCWLIEHHQDDLPMEPESQAGQLLRLLQWADGEN